MSNFGLSCDVCNRENVGITWVNGIKFCAKCYQETFGNNTKEITYVYGGNLKEHIKVIEEKDQRIAELEEQLKNAIVPKFKIGQEVWYLYQRSIFAYEEIKIGRIGAIETFINDIDEKSIKYMIYRFSGDCDLYTTSEHYVFTTKEEAQAKLKELKGE